MFRWYLREWYNVGIGVAIAVLACGVLVDLSTLQQIMLLSFAVLCLHEFEEYGWPGGFPSFMNRVMFPKIADRLGRQGGPSDRYILNQANSVFVNVAAAYPFYALPIFFPHLIWLGLAPILFNLMELVIHGGAATSATSGGEWPLSRPGISQPPTTRPPKARPTSASRPRSRATATTTTAKSPTSSHSGPERSVEK